MKLLREKVKYLIVHQSATKKSQTSFEKIKKFHLMQGMGNIAYHYFIEANGQVRKGRNESTAGTHTKASNMNEKSLGICLAGDFNYEDPDPKQLEALEKVLNSLASKYRIPKENILAHREVIGSVTECPGDSLNEWMVEWRKT
jgi:N-acetylmuramoyl-L-alanine amidase